MVIELTNENFEQEVGKSEGLALVDMYATWCGPCKMLAPILERLSETEADLRVGKVDTEAQAALADRFGVQSIPTLLLFKDGTVVDQSTGLVSKDAIAAMVKAHRA